MKKFLLAATALTLWAGGSEAAQLTGNLRAEQLGIANGVAGLGPNAQVPAANLPAQSQFNVKNFGAVGDGTARALSTKYASLAAAQAVCPEATSLTQQVDWCGIQGALDVAATQTYGSSVVLPYGRYVISTPLALTVASLGAVTLVGQGMTSSEIIQITSGNDGIDVTIANNGTWLRDGGGTGPTYSQKGVAFVKSSGGVAGTGTSITSVSPFAALRAVYTDDIGFRGDSLGGAWSTGMSMLGVGFPDVDNLYCHGPSGGDTASVCLSFAGSSTAGTMIDLNLDNVRSQGGGTAVSIGQYVQGVYIRRLNATGTQHGVVWNSGTNGGPDSLIITSSQLNTVVDAVQADDVSDVQVSSNYIFPIFGGATPTAAANVNIGDTVLNVSSATGIRVGQSMPTTGIPSTARVTAISGTAITVSAAATGAIASGATLTFQNSPDWVGVSVGDSLRYNVNGNTFNGGGIPSQVAVLANNMNGGTISGNSMYLFSGTPIKLTGTTASTMVSGNSCVTCATIGSDSNAGATGNFAASNILNSTLIISGYTTGSQLALGNSLILIGGGGSLAGNNSHGYPFNFTGDGTTTGFRVKTIGGGSAAGKATYTAEVVDGGGTVNPTAAAPILVSGGNAGTTGLGSIGTTGSSVLQFGALYDEATTFVASGSVTGTIAMAVNTDRLVLENASAVATLTVTLPLITALPGQLATISSDTGITVATFQTSTGGTITNAPTSIAAGASREFISDGTNWHPIQ